MYIIKKTDKKITSLFDSVWDCANIAEISQNNWSQFEKAPKTTAKLLYSDFGIHIRMQTEEKPLLARCTEQNGPVHLESCMEFFVRPNEEDKRYINFEFNAFGTMYLALRTGRPDKNFVENNKEYFEVQSCVDEKAWTLGFVIPFEFIKKHFGECSKTLWGNLYKCGEETEYEHYASYYPLDPEKVDFHAPQFFGKFILE